MSEHLPSPKGKENAAESGNFASIVKTICKNQHCIACRHGFSFMEFYNIKFALQKVLNIHFRFLNPYNLMVPNLARAHVSLVRFWVFDQKYFSRDEKLALLNSASP